MCKAMNRSFSNVILGGFGGQGAAAAAVGDGQQRSVKSGSAEDAAFLMSNAETVTIVPGRSEEHTSELQSLMRISYAVFCLKKIHHTTHNHLSNPTALPK